MIAQRLLLFLLDGQRHGLPFDCVERVVHAVEVTPLPGAPEVVLGVIDVQGRLIAAVAPRRRLGLPARELDPAQQFVIARSARRTVAMQVDAVTGVVDYEAGEAFAKSVDIAAAGALVAGVVRLPDGLVLIHDLDRFLSLDEEARLDSAMADA